MKSIVVVGGGVVGLFTAYYAMQRGCKVTVVERGGREHDSCSLGNAGMIVPSHFVPLAAPGMVGLGLRMLLDPEGPFAIRPRLDAALADWCLRFARACSPVHVRRSAPLLRDLNLASRGCYEELATTPGFEFGLMRRGLLMLCKRPETLRDEARLADSACRLGLQAETLGPEQIAKLEPGIAMDVAGAVYFPQDCHLVPERLMACLLGALEGGGATFMWDTEATGGRRSGGTIEALATSRGDLSADEVVIAAGAWSSRLAASFGVRLPLQAGKGYSLTLPSPRRLPEICAILTEARVAVTPMGRALRFAGTMEITGLEGPDNPRRAGGIARAAAEYFPELRAEDFAGVTAWSGLRPCSPDGLPYIGRLREFSNLSVAAGHAMMGVSLGPITGKVMADLLTGEPPTVPMEALAPDRFR